MWKMRISEENMKNAFRNKITLLNEYFSIDPDSQLHKCHNKNNHHYSIVGFSL